jgi:hypothetical protein
MALYAALTSPWFAWVPVALAHRRARSGGPAVGLVRTRRARSIVFEMIVQHSQLAHTAATVATTYATVGLSGRLVWPRWCTDSRPRPRSTAMAAGIRRSRPAVIRRCKAARRPSSARGDQSTRGGHAGAGCSTGTQYSLAARCRRLRLGAPADPLRASDAVAGLPAGSTGEVR